MLAISNVHLPTRSHSHEQGQTVQKLEMHNIGWVRNVCVEFLWDFLQR